MLAFKGAMRIVLAVGCPPNLIMIPIIVFMSRLFFVCSLLVMEAVKLHEETRNPALHVLLRGCSFGARKHIQLKDCDQQLTTPRLHFFPKNEMCLSSLMLSEEWVGFVRKLGVLLSSQSRGLLKQLTTFSMNMVLMFLLMKGSNLSSVKESMKRFSLPVRYVDISARSETMESIHGTAVSTNKRI